MPLESQSHSPMSSSSSIAGRPQASSSAQPTTTPDSEPMSGVQFSALNQGSLPLSVRMHRRNRFGLRPPPPTQRGSTNRFPRLDLSAVNVGLIGAPTLAPENTPAPSNAPSDRSRPGQGLPTIEEALERLPELSSDISASTTLAEMAAPEYEDGFLHSSPVLPSSPTMMGRSSTPPSQRGVREHSDWQEDIEGELDRSLARLANLARDDHEQDPSLPTEGHYTRRLDAAIERQRVRYTYLQEAKSTITSLLLQNARMYSMLEFLGAEVIEDPQVASAVAQLLTEVDREDREEDEEDEEQ